MAPDHPTCHSCTYDFFVVCEGLAPAVVGVMRLDDGGMHPHWPSRVLFQGNARQHLVRKLVRPAKVPGTLPPGPLPQPCKEWEPLAPEDDDAMNAATDVWYVQAKREWASLMGSD